MSKTTIKVLNILEAVFLFLFLIGGMMAESESLIFPIIWMIITGSLLLTIHKFIEKNNIRLKIWKELFR